MSSSTRLLVLGVVQIFQPVHGYDVRRELVSWHAHEWAQIKPGSIYNALKSLTRDGLLEVVGTDQVGGRPERTTYRLTAAGTKQFYMLLRDEWWTVRTPIDPLMAAISFIGYVPRAEAIEALEHRMVQVRSVVRDIARGTAKVDGKEIPLHVREMHRLLSARIAAELDWAEAFIARLRNGEYTTDDEPRWTPGSEQARHAPGRKKAVLGKNVRSKPGSTGSTASTLSTPSTAARGDGFTRKSGRTAAAGRSRNRQRRRNTSGNTQDEVSASGDGMAVDPSRALDVGDRDGATAMRRNTSRRSRARNEVRSKPPQSASAASAASGTALAVSSTRSAPRPQRRRGAARRHRARP